MAANSNKVFTCGASVISLDHKPGEPTVFDKIAQAFSGIGKKQRPSSVVHDSRIAESSHASRTTQESAA